MHHGNKIGRVLIKVGNLAESINKKRVRNYINKKSVPNMVRSLTVFLDFFPEQFKQMQCFSWSERFPYVSEWECEGSPETAHLPYDISEMEIGSLDSSFIYDSDQT